MVDDDGGQAPDGAGFSQLSASRPPKPVVQSDSGR